MHRHKNNVKIISTLLAVLFLFLPYNCVFAFFGAKESKIMKVIESQGSQHPPAEEAEVFKRVILEYTAAGLRDPFEDLVARKKKEQEKLKKEPAATEKLTNLTVSGLVWGGPMPQAVINDKVVKIGDAIEGAQVVAIGKEGVSVRYNNIIYKLPAPASGYIGTGKKEAYR